MVASELKSHEYTLNHDGNFTMYLGIQINHSDDDTVKLSQPRLCQSFLDCVGMMDANFVHTPATGPLF